MGITTAQWVGLMATIIVAILGSSWIGEIIKYKMQRKDSLRDEEDENILILKAGQRSTLKHILRPMMKGIIARPDNKVGIDEFTEMDTLYQAYRAAEGNGEITRLHDIIDQYERVDDDELEEGGRK